MTSEVLVPDSLPDEVEENASESAAVPETVAETQAANDEEAVTQPIIRVQTFYTQVCINKCLFYILFNVDRDLLSDPCINEMYYYP